MLEGFLDLLDRELKVGGWMERIGASSDRNAMTLKARHNCCPSCSAAGPSCHLTTLPAHASPPPSSPTPPSQPLIPSRDDEYQFGLPKPLLRWRDAEPLLEDDARCTRMPPDFRWDSKLLGGCDLCKACRAGVMCCTAKGRSGSWTVAWLACCPLSCSCAARPCRERVWRRYVDDELWNR